MHAHSLSTVTKLTTISSYDRAVLVQYTASSTKAQGKKAWRLSIQGAKYYCIPIDYASSQGKKKLKVDPMMKAKKIGLFTCKDLTGLALMQWVTPTAPIPGIHREEHGRPLSRFCP